MLGGICEEADVLVQISYVLILLNIVFTYPSELSLLYVLKALPPVFSEDPLLQEEVYFKGIKGG